MAVQSRLREQQQVIFDDLLTAAKIVDAPVDSEGLTQNLSVFARFFSPTAEDTAVAYRITTHKKDVSMRYINFAVRHNPYEMAAANGLIERDGHPIEDLIDQLEPQIDLFGYGSDIAVSHGFEKVWPFFAMKPIQDIAKLPALPDAVRQHRDYFAKHKMEQVSVMAIDYYHKSLNLYFLMRGPDGTFKPGGTYTREQWVEMFTDLGFAHPTDAELDIFMQAFVVYPTFSWDSQEIERLCVCMPGGKVEHIPYGLHPITERFVKEAPVQAPPTAYTYCPTYGRDVKYLKMEVDYSGRYMPTIIGPIIASLHA
ncbi:MAG: hypothetical protein HY866_18075 [Chloroflexi bacterium]|nr:hypothetical protein [Chloroflexota bacterium]